MKSVLIPIPSKSTVRNWLFKAVLLLLVVYAAYIVREIWVPLGLALILALVLDPVVDRMEAKKWSRTWATAFIFGSFIIIAVGLIILAAPYLTSQAGQMQKEFVTHFPDRSQPGLYKALLHMNASPGLAQVGSQAIGTLQGGIQKSGSSLTDYAMQFASNVVWVVIIPIVAFYMLRDFHLILAKALLVVPARHRPAMQTAVKEITAIFGNYLRALGIVSVLNGIATGILLEVLRVPSAILLGIIAGILYTVPYIGAVLTVLITAAVAFFAGGPHLMLIVIGASVVLHQIIFDQIISPRILGGHVGLHPILSIIALLCGNLLLGIVGMILAVPVAACIQIAVLAVLPKLAIPIEISPGEPQETAHPGTESDEPSISDGNGPTEKIESAVLTAKEKIDHQHSGEKVAGSEGEEEQVESTPTEKMEIAVAAAVQDIEAQSAAGPVIGSPSEVAETPADQMRVAVAAAVEKIEDESTATAERDSKLVELDSALKSEQQMDTAVANAVHEVKTQKTLPHSDV